MASRDVPGAPPGVRELTALFAPLRFAARQEEAGLARLAGLGGTVRGAVDRARSAGATPGPALDRLEAAGASLDTLPPGKRLAALCRVAADLGSLVPLPADLAALARRSRIPAAAPPQAARQPRRGRGRPLPPPSRLASRPPIGREGRSGVEGSRRLSPRSPARTRPRARCSRREAGRPSRRRSSSCRGPGRIAPRCGGWPSCAPGSRPSRWSRCEPCAPSACAAASPCSRSARPTARAASIWSSSTRRPGDRSSSPWVSRCSSPGI